MTRNTTTKKKPPVRTADAVLYVRCTRKARKAWEKAAEVEGRTLTNWVQYNLDRAASAPAPGTAAGK